MVWTLSARKGRPSYLNVGRVSSDAGLQDLEPLLEAPRIQQAYRNVVRNNLAHLHKGNRKFPHGSGSVGTQVRNI